MTTLISLSMAMLQSNPAQAQDDDCRCEKIYQRTSTPQQRKRMRNRAQRMQDPDIYVQRTNVYVPEDDDNFGSEDLLVNSNDDHLATTMGAAIMVGGGANTTLTDRASNATNPGGNWNVRGVIGTRSILAGELAYRGAANPVEDELAIADDATLLSNGGDVNVRLNIPVAVGANDDTIIEPFATAGYGLQVNDIVNADPAFDDEDVDGDQLTSHIPVGAGIALATDGFIADARVNYRPALNDNVVFGQPSRFDNALDSLSVTGSVGIEF